MVRKEVQFQPIHEARVPERPSRKVQARHSVDTRGPVQHPQKMRDRLPDISGEWFSNRGDRYILDQRGTTFSLVNLNKEQTMTGRIEGESVHAVPESGSEEIIGHIFEIDQDGRAGIMEWSNGVILARKPFQKGRAEVQHNEPQEKAKDSSRSLEHRLEGVGMFRS